MMQEERDSLVSTLLWSERQIQLDIQCKDMVTKINAEEEEVRSLKEHVCLQEAKLEELHKQS